MSYLQGRKILRQYGKAAYRERVRYVNSMITDQKTGIVHTNRRLKRALIFIAVLIMTLGILVVSVEGLRVKLFEFLLVDQDTHTEIEPIEDQEETGEIGEMPNFQLSYVPEGFEIFFEERDLYSIWVGYEGGNENSITFSVSDRNATSVSVDNEHLKREEIMVNDHQGWHFYDGDYSLIMWQVEDYIIDVSSDLGKEVTLKMAESVIIE